MAKPTIVYRAQLDDLQRRLDEIGPAHKIKDPTARAIAQLMQTKLTWLARNLEADQPNEHFQRRMIGAAANAWYRLVVQLRWVPMQRQAEGGKTTALRHKLTAAARESRLKDEAEKLRADNRTLSVADIARILSDSGYGGSAAIRKKLHRLLPD